MAYWRTDITIHVHGHLTVAAKSEDEARKKIMDGHYALSDITIDGDDWEIDYMEETE